MGPLISVKGGAHAGGVSILTFSHLAEIKPQPEIASPPFLDQINTCPGSDTLRKAT
jgi:hypothetical protein